MTSTSQVPNPGSDEAVRLGCWCPVMDNRRGAGIPTTTGNTFWISGGCPIHAPADAGRKALTNPQGE